MYFLHRHSCFNIYYIGLSKVLLGPYSVIFLQLTAVGGDGIEQTVMDDALGNFLPDQLPQDSRELFITDGHV